MGIEGADASFNEPLLSEQIFCFNIHMNPFFDSTANLRRGRQVGSLSVYDNFVRQLREAKRLFQYSYQINS